MVDLTPVLDQNFQGLVGQIFVRLLWGLVLQLPKSLLLPGRESAGQPRRGGWQPSLIAPRQPGRRLCAEITQITQ